MAHDVFISYSSKDKPVSDAVCAGLEARGLRCWVAPRDILPGIDWGAAIIDAITGCKVMVLVFSGNANASQQIKREVERAVAKGVKILPFRIEDVQPSKNMEYFISTAHWMDALTQPLEGHIGRLAETVQFLMTRDSRAVPSETPLPSAPLRPVPVPPPPPPAPFVPPPYRSSRVPLALIAGAAIAVAVLYLLLRKTPPKIVAVNFPATIGVGRSDVTGTVQFKTGHDPVAQAQFDVVSAQNFDPFTIQPRGVAGLKEGSFTFSIRSPIPQEVVLKATLIDSEGRRSSPVTFAFEAKKGVPGQKPIEINLPQFKLKIPR